MIVTIKKAILHIISPGIDSSMYSQSELDITDGATGAFIISHVEKMYDDAGLRTGTFSQNSGLKYHLRQYKSGETNFVELSTAIAQKLQEGIAQSEVGLCSDIIVCDSVIHERNHIIILKCDNKSGMSHRVISDGESLKTEIIGFHEILPSSTQKLSECAFIDLDDFTLRFKGKSVTLDGQRVNLMSDVLLECESELSVSETYSKVQSYAKKVSEDYGADTVETDARIKQVIKEAAIEEDKIDVARITESVFSTMPAAKAEFREKIKSANIPEEIEIVEYITKKANKKIKILTDNDMEILIPAEFYRDGENMIVEKNDDDTISIKLNNIRDIINKS